MKIPSRLSEILQSDPQLDGCVRLSFEAFEPWLALGEMPFFPEYTDHGPKHVEDVLKTGEALISDAAYQHITSGDAACLALSVLLHDAAMHLSEDGFISLVSAQAQHGLIKEFGDTSWNALWLDFLGEASRFDGRKLRSLFGNTEPVRRPPLAPERMTKRDRKLIGEFLRRHHHRLAHEFALFGVPGGSGEPLGLVEVPEYMKRLAGAVARSHGLPVRRCIDYLHSAYSDREYKAVHPAFLMGVLRIADYLQVQSERAPATLLRVRQLRSPLSEREWKAHHAIRDIRQTHEDPEALFIDTQSTDVTTYFRVKEWLKGIQDEMDASWALLGEVYGRYTGLKELGFVLRRVRSNIDEVAEFAKSVDYVPCQASFEAANPDLLKLLVGPLYGNRAEIALRELVQNAVDAVRELRQYRKDRPDQVVAPSTSEDADVTFTFDKRSEKEWWVIVSDQGIGMSLSTVLDYFLKIGASYRQSDVWRQLFEDKSGRTSVLRSGRFGVGVLASFLLGDEIRVETRYVDAAADQGITFATTLDEETIQIERKPLPVGTTVRILVRGERATVLNNWFGSVSRFNEPEAKDMYCLASPRVKRILKPGNWTLKQQFLLPEPGCTVPPNWRSIRHKDYQEIHWTYEKAPYLACNGIIVSSEKTEAYDDRGTWDTWWQEWEGVPLAPPNVSVFDPDGKLPLTLQRTAIARCTCPFGKALLEDVVKDYIAFLLVRGPTRFSPTVLCEDYLKQYRHPSFGDGARLQHCFLTHNGFGPLFTSNMMRKGIKRVFVFGNLAKTGQPPPTSLFRKRDALCALFPGGYWRGVRWIDEWLRFVFLRSTTSINDPLVGQLAQLPVKTVSMVMRREHIERFDRLKSKPLSPSRTRSLSRPWGSSDWGSMCDKGTSDLDPVLTTWAESNSGTEGSARVVMQLRCGT